MENEILDEPIQEKIKSQSHLKSDDELEQKLNNPSLVDEAKIAVKEILDERSPQAH